MALGYAVGNDLIADRPIALTRAAYDALTPVSDQVYIITDELVGLTGGQQSRIAAAWGYVTKSTDQ